MTGIRHVASGTEFKKNNQGNWEITKQGTKGDCWINGMPIGYSRPMNNLETKIDNGWIERI